MNIKKEAPASSAKLTGAKDKATCGTASNPIIHSTTAAPSRQIEIANCLGHGQSAAVPLQHLISMTGLDGRTIRLMIERERRSGIPILADNSTGYYLAGDEAEAARFVASMRHRAREILTTASAIERACGLD